MINQDYPDFEVIVADNGSMDNSYTIAQHLGARWLALGQNIGLAGALNAGSKAAAGDLFLFLNNDLRLRADFVRSLARPLLEDPTVFAADALQWDWEGRVRVHGRTRVEASSIWLGRFDLSQDYPADCVPAFMASAANALVRRSMFEKLGGWDLAYFLGWEDVDLFWRAWQRGWRTLFVPHAVCWHKIGGSAATDTGATFHLRGNLEGRLYFASKCLPASGAIAVWGKTCGGLLRDVAVGRWHIARGKAVALAKAVRLLGSAVRGRHDLYSTGPGPWAYLRALASLTR